MEKKGSQEDGYTFILVIWILVILSIIFVNLLDEVALENILVRHQYQENLIRQTALSGISAGIARLKQDENSWDSSYDPWAEGFSGSVNQLQYDVQITDIGSLLNLNYDSPELLSKLNYWNDDLTIYTADELVADLIFCQDLITGDHTGFYSSVTVLGKYNINFDDSQGLRKLMKFVGIDDYQIDYVINSLQEFRTDEDKGYFNTLEEIPIQLQGMDMITFERLLPYLSLEGRVNLNLVDESLLPIILSGLGLNSELAEDIIAYRQQQAIKSIEELSLLLTEEALEKIIGYFNCTSRYFQIISSVTPPEGEEKIGITAVAERRLDINNQWKVEVIKWQE